MKRGLDSYTVGFFECHIYNFSVAKALNAHKFIFKLYATLWVCDFTSQVQFISICSLLFTKCKHTKTFSEGYNAVSN